MLTAGCRKAAEVLLPTTHDRDIASGCKVHATRPQLPFPMSTNPQARNLGFCRENPRWSLVSNEAGAGLPVYDNHIALSAARHPHCNVGNEALRCACAACADPGNDFDAPTVAARGSDGIALLDTQLGIRQARHMWPYRLQVCDWQYSCAYCICGCVALARSGRRQHRIG